MLLVLVLRLSVGLRIMFPTARLARDKTDSGGDSPVHQETQADQDTSRQCESSYTAEEDASSTSESLSSDSKVTHSDVTATEDATKDLLAEQSSSDSLLAREPEERTEQEAQESRSQGTLRNRYGPRGELVAAQRCSSTTYIPTVSIGIRNMAW